MTESPSNIRGVGHSSSAISGINSSGELDYTLFLTTFVDLHTGECRAWGPDARATNRRWLLWVRFRETRTRTTTSASSFNLIVEASGCFCFGQPLCGRRQLDLLRASRAPAQALLDYRPPTCGHRYQDPRTTSPVSPGHRCWPPSTATIDLLSAQLARCEVFPEATRERPP